MLKLHRPPSPSISKEHDIFQTAATPTYSQHTKLDTKTKPSRTPSISSAPGRADSQNCYCAFRFLPPPNGLKLSFISLKALQPLATPEEYMSSKGSRHHSRRGTAYDRSLFGATRLSTSQNPSKNRVLQARSEREPNQADQVGSKPLKKSTGRYTKSAGSKTEVTSPCEHPKITSGPSQPCKRSTTTSKLLRVKKSSRTKVAKRRQNGSASQDDQDQTIQTPVPLLLEKDAEEAKPPFDWDKGHKPSHKMLLDLLGSLNGPRADGSPGPNLLSRIPNPLFEAARTNNLEECERLVGEDWALDDANAAGLTPLCLAAEQGHCNIAQFLIENGANANGLQKGFPSPLYLALKHQRADMVKLLLSHNEVKVDCITAGSRGERSRPIDVAMEWKDKEVLGLLKQRLETLAAESEYPTWHPGPCGFDDTLEELDTKPHDKLSKYPSDAPRETLRRDTDTR